MTSLLNKIKNLLGKKESDILSSQEFTEEFVAFTQPRLPDLELTVFGSQLINVTQYEKVTPVYVDKLYKLYKETPAKKNDFFEDFASTLVKKFAAPDKTIDIGKIIPLIKTKAWLDKFRSTAQAENDGKVRELIYNEFVDELVVIYAEKVPDGFTCFFHEDLYRTGLSREKLHPTAIRNLPAQIGPIQLHQGPGTHMLVANELFESSLCLLDDVLNRNKLPAIKGELIFAVPASDTLIVTGSEEVTGIRRTKEIVAEVFRKNENPLSLKLFIQRNGHWSIFDQA